jgi:electron transfer flavoprotein alpha subunit
MMASTLVISEPLDIDGITPAGTQSTVTAAIKLNSSGSSGNDTINLLVVGSIVPTKIPMGISKVFHVPIDDKLSETVAKSVIEIIDGGGDDDNNDCTVVIGTASKFGSTVIPRTAALLDVSPITDILEIQDESKSSIQ